MRKINPRFLILFVGSFVLLALCLALWSSPARTERPSGVSAFSQPALASTQTLPPGATVVTSNRKYSAPET